VPAQTRKRRSGLKGRSPRDPALPEPGIGGYDYPRGPYGQTGFPGSTPASRRTHSQGPDGRLDRQLSVTGAQARDTGPEFAASDAWDVPRPQPSYSEVEFRPGMEPDPGNRYLRPDGSPRQPRARQMRSTAPEHRMTPVIGGAPGSQNVRNTYAQRYKAVPGQIRAYRPAPNPGKTGARLDGPSRYHPDVMVHGHPDGKPVPGMAPQPGYPPTVTVPSRYVSHEGSQEGYAMNRELHFTKGGTPAPYPAGYDGNEHIRGGRLTGQRYFGDLADQQRIGLDSDAFGIARRRGPRHRPVRFELPTPHAANFYDVAPDQGTEAPDMIHKSPAKGRPHAAAPTTRSGVGRTSRKPRRG
jgi:hypothetical protein